MNILFPFGQTLRGVAAIMLLAAPASGAQPAVAPKFLTAQDVVGLPAKAPIAHIAYAREDPLQFGELRLPNGAGPFPVAVVIHGGCYQKRFADLHIMDAMSSALADEGIATWNIEYRKIDEPGGAWPGMFRDIAAGVDYLSALAKKFPLDLARVIAVGHSAGGHLALWAAARPKVPKDSPLWVASPMRLCGAVNADGPSDLQWLVVRKGMLCGADVMEGLVGPVPDAQKNLKTTSPTPLFPLGARQAMVYRSVPNPWATPEEFVAYAEQARRAGDSVLTQSVENVGHFEFLAPGSAAWPDMIRAVKWALQPLPPANP